MRLRWLFVAMLPILVPGAVGARTASAGCATSDSRSLELLSARTGAVLRDFPGVRRVAAIAVDGRGGWFVSADRSCIGDGAASLVRLDHAGRVETGWHAALPRRASGVTRLLRSGPILYAAGAFGVVALDAATGARRWRTAVSAGPDAGVLALAASPQALYIGGGFHAVGGAPHAALAELDALDRQSPRLAGSRAREQRGAADRRRARARR